MRLDEASSTVSPNFRFFWARKSQKRKQPQPKISATTIALIEQMAMENRTYVKRADMWS